MNGGPAGEGLGLCEVLRIASASLFEPGRVGASLGDGTAGVKAAPQLEETSRGGSWMGLPGSGRGMPQPFPVPAFGSDHVPPRTRSPPNFIPLLPLAPALLRCQDPTPSPVSDLLAHKDAITHITAMRLVNGVDRYATCGRWGGAMGFHAILAATTGAVGLMESSGDH